MGHSVLPGVSLVLIAGLMAGCCMLPLKFVRSWKWENVWLVFSILSLVVIPWSLALTFVGRLFDTYRALSAQQLAVPMLLGAGWGIAQIVFGLSVKRLGLGIAYAIIVGLGAVLREKDLQELLGIKVHIGTEKSLHWYVRDRILREATPL